MTMLKETAKGFCYKISSEFGSVDSVHKTPHKGIDIAMPEGTPLSAVHDGVVVNVGHDDKLGEFVKLKLDNDEYVLYGHLSDVKAREFDVVEKGDLIALSGNTGNSTGPHLHLQYMKDGVPTDPNKFVENSTDVKEGMGFVDSMKDMSHFFSDVRHEGMWYAMTGQHFPAWCATVTHDFIVWTINVADYSIVGLMILGILNLAGWKNAKKYMYWTSIVYLLLKIWGLYL